MLGKHLEEANEAFQWMNPSGESSQIMLQIGEGFIVVLKVPKVTSSFEDSLRELMEFSMLLYVWLRFITNT